MNKKPQQGITRKLRVLNHAKEDVGNLTKPQPPVDILAFPGKFFTSGRKLTKPQAKRF